MRPHPFGRFTLLTLFILIAGCGPQRTLSRSQSVQLQRAVCSERPDGAWAVAIRGGVYEKSWLNHIEPFLIEWLESHKVLKNADEAAALQKRLELFLDDHPSGIALEVMVGNVARPLPTSAGGRISGSLMLTPQEVKDFQTRQSASAGWLAFRVRGAQWDHREFLCEAMVLPQKGLSIVSDIDDTIKITDVNNTKLMLQNMFLRPYRAVPGMAELYAAWE